MDKQNVPTEQDKGQLNSPKLGVIRPDAANDAGSKDSEAPRSESISVERVNKEVPVKKLKIHSRNQLHKNMGREDSEYLIDNLAMLLASGVTVSEALDAIIPELPNKNLQNKIVSMRRRVDEGIPFSRAMEETGLFNKGVVTLVSVGESSGNLAENLKVISRQMHKNNIMNSKVRSALLYPSFLISLLIIVGSSVGIFLLPRLLTLINGLQVQVNAVTRLLIKTGTFFGRFGFLIIAGLGILLFLTWIATKFSTRARAAVEGILFKLPGIRRLLIQTETARFGFVFGTLLEAGLPIETSLESLAGSMSTYRYQNFANDLRKRVTDGTPISQVFTEPKVRKLLSGTVCQIVVSAEHSGNLASALLKIGENYEEKADITARNLEILIEPIVLVIIAVGVLLVALAVFLPIYSLIGNFGGAK